MSAEKTGTDIMDIYNVTKRLEPKREKEFKSFVICKNLDIENIKEEDYPCIVPETFYEAFQGKFDARYTIVAGDNGVFIVREGENAQVVKVPDSQVDKILDILDKAFHVYALAFCVAKRGTKLHDKINVSRARIGNVLLREKYCVIPDAEKPFDIVLINI